RQVANAVQAGSVTLPAGTLVIDGQRIVLAVREQPIDAEQVAETQVDPVRDVRVRDLGRVQDAELEPNAFTRLNGQPIVTLDVRKISGANTVGTARGVKQRLAGIDLPDGVRADVIDDSSVFVEASVLDTVRETGLAVLAVALVVLLFLGRLGSTFSVVLAIPITLTGAVIIFGLLGFTFNTVTLLAITVAVGLVVDDSIVIAENVTRWRRKGLGPIEAVLKGAGEVSVAVLSATLSLLAVFLPIAFLPGLIGQFFSQFGLSLAATIAVSYLEAMFFLTVRLAYLPDPYPPGWDRLPGAVRRMPGDLLRTVRLYRRPAFLAVTAAALIGVVVDAMLGGPLASGASAWTGLDIGARTAAVHGAATLAMFATVPWLVALGVGLSRIVLHLLGAIADTAHRFVDRSVEGLRDRYGVALARILTPRSSLAVLSVAVLLVGSLGWVFPRIQFNFVSELDVGQVAIAIDMPPGTPLDRTDVVSAAVERELTGLPEVRNVIARIGGGGLTSGEATDRSRITVELVGLAERDVSSFELADRLRPSIHELLRDLAPEADVSVGSDDGGAVPVETGLSLTLRADDRELLEEREARARELMRDHPWLRNVTSSLEGSVDERVFVVDRAALAGTGLTVAEVGQAIRTYNVGTSAGTLDAGGEDVAIVVRIDPRRITDEQALLSVPVYASALQSWLPLSALGSFQVQAGPIAIDRANQRYIATLSAALVQGSPGQFQIRTDVEEAFARAGVTDDRVSVGTGVGPDLLGDLVFYGPIAFALALVLNFLVIASQFNSFTYPLYLLATVPLALVGAFWLFFLTGSALDVISVLGVVILIGLVTKNAILLLDVVIAGLEKDETLERALVRAGRLRLRPILMTAITVVIISVPLLLGLGEGSEFRRPLGLVIVGGVVSSTFLTLFVVPAAFYRFERHRFARSDADVALATDAPADDADAVDPPSRQGDPDRS
ncbi:MAG: efflux RND transporter permease subunit, partial [Trueperaceae bacterium]